MSEERLVRGYHWETVQDDRRSSSCPTFRTSAQARGIAEIELGQPVNCRCWVPRRSRWARFKAWVRGLWIEAVWRFGGGL